MASLRKSSGHPAFSVRKRMASFGYAWAGLRYLLASQQNAWIHLAATLIVVTLCFVCELSVLEWSAILLCVGFVWTAEAFNTALEALVDLVSPEDHPLAKVAKDVSAGAVLIAAVVAVIVGTLIFLPRLLPLL